MIENKDNIHFSKISFVTEPFAKIGGCQMQLLSWKNALANSGIDVNFSMDISKSDIIHCFPIENPSLFNQLRKRTLAKTIVSTNYWSNIDFLQFSIKRLSLKMPALFKNNFRQYCIVIQ
jgi:hypothetical protein